MEPAPNINGVPLRDYVEALFTEREKAVEKALQAQEKAVNAALEASDKAITKAEANAEKWRENANEWRGAMSDRDRELPSRREVEAATKSLEEKYRSLMDRIVLVEASQTRIGGREEGTTKKADADTRLMIFSVGVFFSIITIAVAVAALAIK
jgi:hypothetical protein